MIRRTSLPSLPFTDSKRHRRLSAPPPDPLPSLPNTKSGFVRVHVADFVAAPSDRLSLNRNVLGPIDLARRPPCYDLRPQKKGSPRSIALPQHVFEIRDQKYIDTLTGILNGDEGQHYEHKREQRVNQNQQQAHQQHLDRADNGQDDVSDAPSEEDEYSESESGDDVAEYPEISHSQIDEDETEEHELEHEEEDQETEEHQSREEHQPSEAFEVTASEDIQGTVGDTSPETLGFTESALTHDSEDDSDIELTNQYDDLCEYDDQSDIGVQVDPDFDFDKRLQRASFILAAMSEENNTITSNVLSTSSLADTSLSEFPTIASIDTADGASETPSSIPRIDEHDPVLVAVESMDGLVERKKTLPSFMRKKVPSPTKYTFRPLHKVPSNLTERPESNEITSIVPSKHPSRKTPDICRHADAPCDSDSQEENLSAKSPTLSAVKSVVEKLDPHTAMGIVNVPPLALATVGFFKKKRDSEESTWSRKSDGSSRRKRESDESTQSSNTEYYEDEYTKFISKKNSPLSPLRIRGHPYFAKIKSCEDGLKLTKSGFRRSSSVSVSTSDEEYAPHSTSSHSTSSKSNTSQTAGES